MKRNDLDVLYVEDDSADVEFAETMMSEVGCGRIKLRVLPDGEAASHQLGIDPAKASTAGRIPNMIILDLNLPRVSGKELLRRIKNSERLSCLPVVILSTSDHQSDIDDAYRLGAAGFFTKASELGKGREIFSAICNYWSENAQLPLVAEK